MATYSLEEVMAEGQPNTYSLEEVLGEPQPAAKKPGFGERVDAGIADIPRQLGLTARYGIEGLGQVADIVGAPIASTLNYLDPTRPAPASPVANALDPIDYRFSRPSENTRSIANALGLPQPQDATERIVGDASRMLASGAGMVKAAQAVSGTTIPVVRPLVSKIAGNPYQPISPSVGPMRQLAAPLAARPGLQAASAVGSGLSGGYARETGGSPTAQFVASVLGGVAAPGAVAGVNAGRNYVKNVVDSIRDVRPTQVTVQIKNALENAGYKDVPKSVYNQIEQDAANAMRHGDLSQDALRRLVDYRMVGATPARGNLTLNPVDLTRQQNLAKVGANSPNAKLQQLAMRQNTNTGTLIRNLNELGADTADDAFSAGQKVLGGLGQTAGKKQAVINMAYDRARSQTGIDAAIDPAAFTRKADDLLNENLLHGALPPDVRKILNDASTGKMPLTVRTAEQIKTAMGNLQRSSSDGSVRKAIGLVRQALDDAPIMQGQGDDAVRAFNQARGLNRQWRTLVEKTPALQALEDGVQPDKFVQDYIIRGSGKSNVMDVARLKNVVKDSPDAMQAIRGQILAHLKAKATSGKPDEAMTFSQSGYNNAFSAIGERKLRMFFSKAEIDKMKAVGRVAMYEQIQPSGSAVNNSNTAAMGMANLFDLIANNKVVNAIPFGSAAIGTPAQSISTTIQGSGVSNIPRSLVAAPQASQPLSRLPLPLLLTPGLLEQPGNN